MLEKQTIFYKARYLQVQCSSYMYAICKMAKQLAILSLFFCLPFFFHGWLIQSQLLPDYLSTPKTTVDSSVLGSDGVGFNQQTECRSFVFGGFHILRHHLFGDF